MTACTCFAGPEDAHVKGCPLLDDPEAAMHRAVFDDEVDDEAAVLLDMQGIGVWLSSTARAVRALDGGDESPEDILELPRAVLPDELRVALLASANLARAAGLTPEVIEQEAAVFLAMAEPTEETES